MFDYYLILEQFKKLTPKKEYDGEWSNGLQNGYGIGITLKNGKRTVYKGQWKDGLHHGPGRAEYSDGSVLVGEWNMGRKQGAFQVLYSTGDNDDSTRFNNDKINRERLYFLNSY